VALAPELGALSVLALAALLVCLLFAYRVTLGQLLSFLIDVLSKVVIHIPYTGVKIQVFAPAIVLLEAINNGMYAALGGALNLTSWAWHKFVHWNAYLWHELTQTIAGTPAVTAKAISYLVKHRIPLMIGAATGPLGLWIATHTKQIRALFQEVARIAEHPGRIVTHTITKVQTIEHTVTKIIYKTVPAAVTKAVAIPWGAIHGLERDVAADKKRIGKLEKGAVAIGVGAVAGAVLGRLGLNWTRCSNVNKLGKAACGMNPDLLEGLLAGAVVVASSISVVEFAKSCQAFTGTVEDGLKFFVRELH
jgi:hypothetical protein